MDRIAPAAVNSTYYVDGRAYTTIQAAITAAGTTGAVVIPAKYSGVDTFTNPNNILIFDYRGGKLTISGASTTAQINFGFDGNGVIKRNGPQFIFSFDNLATSPFIFDNVTGFTTTKPISASGGITAGGLTFISAGTISNTDLEGTIAVSASTTGTYTFLGTYTNAPNCQLTPTSDPTATGVYWATATNLVLTAHVKTSGTITFNYHCYITT